MSQLLSFLRDRTGRRRIGLWRHCRFRFHDAPGELDLIFCSHRRWERIGYGLDPAWRTMEAGPFIVAARVRV